MKQKRYSRHEMIPEIGTKGQQKLTAASVSVVGAGGLGSPVLYYLASAGFGNIKIIDSDVVDISNLNRQFIHFESDIGKQKDHSAKRKLEQYNSDISITTQCVRLDFNNASEFLKNSNIIVTCVDNTETRYIVNKFCVDNRIPYVDGGVTGFDGYVLTVLPGVCPCYQCIFPKKKKEGKNKSFGVLGASAGVIGSFIAMQTIKQITGICIDTYFYYIDTKLMSISPIPIEKHPGCPVCAGM